jgi:hypothetical protein
MITYQTVPESNTELGYQKEIHIRLIITNENYRTLLSCYYQRSQPLLLKNNWAVSKCFQRQVLPSLRGLCVLAIAEKDIIFNLGSSEAKLNSDRMVVQVYLLTA